MMRECIKVGLIQSVLDSKLAWFDTPKMDPLEARNIWRQIQSAFASFKRLGESEKPDLVMIPELSVSNNLKSGLIKFAQELKTMIIAGLDFYSHGRMVENRALIYIPREWPASDDSSRSVLSYFGKHFASREELNAINKWSLSFNPCNEFYIIDTESFGKIGVAICADFYDIERYAIYKGRIQNLFIIANNQDVKSFYFLAEAISRLVFCNVVICNSGHYGGSVCFTLSKKDYERYQYKHEGKNLFTSQIVRLPVEHLYQAQLGNKYMDEFKSAPPGYVYHYKPQK